MRNLTRLLSDHVSVLLTKFICDLYLLLSVFVSLWVGDQTQCRNWFFLLNPYLCGLSQILSFILHFPCLLFADCFDGLEIL